MADCEKFELVVIGSGPAGQKAAIQALKLGKKVALVDANADLGGNCLRDGTIPSKSFREGIAHLTGYRQRNHYGPAYRVKQNITMQDLTNRMGGIEKDLAQTIKEQIQRNHGEIIAGFATFIDPYTIKISNGSTERYLNFEKIIISVGTRPARPATFDFDGRVILDSDAILQIKDIPKSLTVVGGGVIGTEYGSMFAALGVSVTIVEQRDSILGFLDQEIVETLVHSLRQRKVSVITGDKVVSCKKTPDGRAVTHLESGRRIVSDILLVSAGRVGNSDGLRLSSIGVTPNERGLLRVTKDYQLEEHEHIYAVGDVIGLPALASTSMEQGRRAAAHAFGLGSFNAAIPLPYGIYSIPEIGCVGATEAELRRQRVPYEFGVAHFSEIARGRISGDQTGFLKLLFHRTTHQLIGVHIIGEGATELVHIGQTVMCFKGGIEYLVNAVFNYPTLATAYKTAALDAWNKIVATQGLPEEGSEELDHQNENEINPEFH